MSHVVFGAAFRRQAQRACGVPLSPLPEPLGGMSKGDRAFVAGFMGAPFVVAARSYRMAKRPVGAFSPPNTLAENANQLRNLAATVSQSGDLTAATTTAETTANLNELVKRLRRVTRGRL